ncbi:MAG: peptide ABC transporter substrate-binding protein, partial [Leuconostoc citreum]|nr:peptide ABC transporter substrate-binding protein [Leuconostoc citreum]
MNKRLMSVIAIIVAFLAVAFVMTNNPTAVAKKKNYVPTVGILQLVTHPALDEIHRGIIAGLKSQGYTKNKIKI